MLYEMLTGQAPFQADTPLAVAMAHRLFTPAPPSELADVPSDLEAVVLRTLAKDPEERFPSAAALAQELRRWREGLQCSGSVDEAERKELTPEAPTALPEGSDRYTTRLLSHQDSPRPEPPRTSRRSVLVGVGLLAALLAGLQLSGLDSMATPQREDDRPGTAAALAPANSQSATTTTTTERTEPQTVEEAIAELQDHIHGGIAEGMVSLRAADDLLSKIEEVEEEWEDQDPKDARQKLEDVEKKADERARDGDITSADFLDELYRRTELIRQLMGSGQSSPSG